MLFPEHIIESIEGCIEWADRLTRADLAAGIVVTENDYTSNFTSALRREIASRNIPGLKARVQVLSPSIERANGVDGCIILSNLKEFKVGMFEAKWPRLSTDKNSWDSLQRSTGRSHFDDQVARQRVAAKAVAVWEMFYSEHEFGEQPNYMPNEGSACVWHDHAYEASRARPNKTTPWTDEELESLLRKHCTTPSSVVREICECKRGKAMPEQDYATALSNYGAPDKALVVSYSKPRGKV